MTRPLRSLPYALLGHTGLLLAAQADLPRSPNLKHSPRHRVPGPGSTSGGLLFLPLPKPWCRLPVCLLRLCNVGGMRRSPLLVSFAQEEIELDMQGVCGRWR
jgi:hypothetical protein